MSNLSYPLTLFEAGQELSDVSWRLFAADCLERMIPFAESWFPPHYEPSLVVETTRRFVSGKATEQELTDASLGAAKRARYYQLNDAAIVVILDAASWVAATELSGLSLIKTDRPIVSAAQEAIALVLLAVEEATPYHTDEEIRTTARMKERQKELRWQLRRLSTYLSGEPNQAGRRRIARRHVAQSIHDVEVSRVSDTIQTVLDSGKDFAEAVSALEAVADLDTISSAEKLRMLSLIDRLRIRLADKRLARRLLPFVQHAPGDDGIVNRQRRIIRHGILLYLQA